MNLSNIISWILAIIFAFITNKLYVFKSVRVNRGLVMREFVKFISSRIVTGAMEIGLLPLLICLGFDYHLLGIEGFAAKLVISIVVVIVNYVLSKYLVFNFNNREEVDR